MILSINPIHEEGEMAINGEITYTRELLVRTNDPTDGEYEIWSSRLCPVVGDPHPRHNLSFAKSVAVRRKGNSKYHWLVTVQYSSERKPDEDEENPLNIPAEITLTSENSTEEAQVDRKGNPLLNAAGEQIRGIERRRSNWVIEVKKNVAFVPDWALDIPDCINQAPIKLRGKTWGRETLMITGMTVGPDKLKGKILYSEVALTMTHNKNGWHHEELNRGYSELADKKNDLGLTIRGRNGKPVQIRQRVLVGNPPEPPAEPVFLDLSGRRPRDADGNPKEQLDPGEIVVIRFDLYQDIPFNWPLLK